ncbi:hypothetical protein [Tahibacter amnicola]|uniref:Delta-60 repeat protein n=1 Tax=Tahibacter amnicola TaxID=2976241 RepID=A0ABY6B840_9GAMM|nr:hypothetical protein [Tahibacter amnicola]UXI65942.1 hypothetical protein N4264_14380 [Tahibacter amnicola]
MDRLSLSLVAATLLIASTGSDAANPAVATPDPGFFCGTASVCTAAPRSQFNVDLGGVLEDTLKAIVPLVDGRSVLIGRARDDVNDADLVFGRLSANGTRDFTFGGPAGIRNYPGPDSVQDIQVDAQGRYLVMFRLNAGFTVARYLPDGLPDTNFSGDGSIDVDIGVSTRSAGALMVLPDGKIAAIISVFTSSTTYDIGFARLTTDGNLDSTFDGDGKGVYAISSFRPWLVNGMTLRRNGRWFISASIESAAGPTTQTLALACTAGTGSNSIICDETTSDALDFATCASQGATGGTHINDIVRMPNGSVLGVGTYYPYPYVSGNYRALAVLWDANSLDMEVAKCLAGSSSYIAKIRRTGTGSAVTHFRDSAEPTKAFAMAMSTNGVNDLSFGPISLGVDWPTQAGTSSDLGYGGFSLAYLNGKVYLGASRRWVNSDFDFAVARYNTDELFSSSMGD